MTDARKDRRRWLEELRAFVRFPSISAQPNHARDVQRCAQWLAEHLRLLHLEHVRVIPTARHPIVYADWLHAPGRPTVVVYGHYDVQPADPLEDWTTPPFEPVVRNGAIFGRGACDDKGQMFAHVKSLEHSLRSRGRLPVNVKCIFEGEEEIGSPNLVPFLTRNRPALAADVVVMSDSPMADPGRPAITTAVRGSLGMELTVQGPRHDLHSGLFGGAIHNPLQALGEIVASLHDVNGRITIPGFYDRVRELSLSERAALGRDAPSDERVLREASVARGWGERGYTLHERTTIRPALTINGLRGGYHGPGGKAVIPSIATAKLSFRLVPDQEPEEIALLFRKHLAHVAPRTVRCATRTTSRARPAVVDQHHPAVRAAVAACRSAFGKLPAFQRMGGTVPVVGPFQELLSAPVVLMGFAPPDARIHAPNENFSVATFFGAIAASNHFLHAVGEVLPARWPNMAPGHKSKVP
jgi:acetylornithine deacetylase/succinyl-diaminopimelate desuccinylase-like protein